MEEKSREQELSVREISLIRELTQIRKEHKRELGIRALLYWMSLNRKQILFQYRYRNVKNLKIYLCQICRNSLKMYNDRAVRLLRKEC